MFRELSINCNLISKNVDSKIIGGNLPISFNISLSISPINLYVY